MRRIAVINQKGGVGKTTSVVNMAAALAAMGQKVLVIDLDPQGHLTIHLGHDAEKIEKGTYAVLAQSAGLDESIIETRPNLFLLPANIHLVGAESELVSVVGREIILKEAIDASQRQFDYLFVDCAPSLGLLTLNALAAVDEVMIPVQPHFLGLQGFGKLLQTIELVNKRINTSLKVRWILLCMYDNRLSLSSEVKADIEQFLASTKDANCAWAGAQILPVAVRRNIKLAEAPSYGKTIFEYDGSCNGAQDYRKAAECIHYGKLSNATEKEEKVLATENTRLRSAQADSPAANYGGQAETTEKCPIKIVEIQKLSDKETSPHPTEILTSSNKPECGDIEKQKSTPNY
jgi:chromosome partitioning protein